MGLLLLLSLRALTACRMRALQSVAMGLESQTNSHLGSFTSGRNSTVSVWSGARTFWILVRSISRLSLGRLFSWQKGRRVSLGSVLAQPMTLLLLRTRSRSLLSTNFWFFLSSSPQCTCTSPKSSYIGFFRSFAFTWSLQVCRFFALSSFIPYYQRQLQQNMIGSSSAADSHRITLQDTAKSKRQITISVDYDCSGRSAHNKIMKKYLKARTKSEVAHPCPSPFLSHDGLHSRTAYVKFKPFSKECSILNIEERLQCLRKTATHLRTSHLRSSTAEEPLMARLGSIIKGGSKRRRRNLTEVDIRSEGSSRNSHVLEDKLKRLKRRSATIKKHLPTEHCEAREEELGPVQIVRQDLSQQAVEQEKAFFATMHRPDQSQLLADFNKSNCYVFSRSKQKVIAEDLQKPRFQPEPPIVSSNGKFASFSSYFYGSYMKKYKERRRLLSKKTTLARIVAQ